MDTARSCSKIHGSSDRIDMQRSTGMPYHNYQHIGEPVGRMPGHRVDLGKEGESEGRSVEWAASLEGVAVFGFESSLGIEWAHELDVFYSHHSELGGSAGTSDRSGHSKAPSLSCPYSRDRSRLRACGHACSKKSGGSDPLCIRELCDRERGSQHVVNHVHLGRYWSQERRGLP